MQRGQHFQSQWRPPSVAVLVILLGVAFIIAVSAVGFWKYAHYRYQGLDLAIYTNVLYNLSHGNGWYSSIQGGSYLGDHVEPILLALAPLFRVWPDARLLIILQALVLGLTAVPVYALLSDIHRRRGIDRLSPPSPPLHDVEREGDWKEYPPPPHEVGRGGAGGRGGMRTFTLVALWLLNPLLWNAALFEFHALALAPLFILSAAVAYQRRRFWWFLFFIFLSLSVREDIALIVAMFGVVAAVDRWHDVFLFSRVSPLPQRTTVSLSSEISNLKSMAGSERGWVWIVAPILFGLLWFFLATRIAAANSASGAYKFLIYYGWLRDALGQPSAFLQHFVSIGNIDMVLGLLLPFLFLPLVRPRWLLLAIPPFLQILLAAPGGSNVVVETHYALLFVPGLVMATIDAAQMFSPSPDGRGSEPAPYQRESFGVGRGRGQSRCIRWLTNHFPLPKPFALGLGIATFLAAAWALGPFPGIARILLRSASVEDRARRVAYDAFLARVPPDAAVAASYAALSHVAARSSVYSLAYAYLGVTQYGLSPYVLSEDLRYLLLDERDAVAYAVQFPNTGWSAPYAASGPENLRRLVDAGRFGVIGERNGVALLERDLRAVGGLPFPSYFRAAAPPGARLVVDALRDVTVDSQ